MSDGQESSILDLGRDLARLHRELESLTSSWALEVPDALDALDDIERRIAERVAGDEAEAAVQLMLVHYGLGHLADELDDDLQDQVKRAAMMVASALQVLVTRSQIDLAAFASDWYLATSLCGRSRKAVHPRDTSVRAPDHT